MSAGARLSRISVVAVAVSAAFVVVAGARQSGGESAPPAKPPTSAVTPAPQDTPATPADRPLIVGYLFPGERAMAADEIDAAKLTHVIHAFANIREGEMVEGFARDAENLRTLTTLRRAHPHLKVLVAVGGWTWSKGFSDMALTAERRARFVESAVALARRHDLDGIDVDWEYPGLRGDDNPHRPEDREHFTALLAELRQALDRDGEARGRRLLLTIAAGAFPEFLANVEPEKLQHSLDFVNLMTYDFRVPDADPIAGHHANLFAHPDDPRQLSADRAVRDFVRAGFPARQLVLGVPFYGRAWTAIEGDGPGLYRLGSPMKPRLDTSPAALDALLAGGAGWTREWDDTAQAPYLWNPATRSFVSIDDERSLRVKSRYVREQGLAGVMFWQYFADRTGRLLSVLHRELHGGR
jgi:chitinase